MNQPFISLPTLPLTDPIEIFLIVLLIILCAPMGVKMNSTMWKWVGS